MKEYNPIIILESSVKCWIGLRPGWTGLHLSLPFLNAWLNTVVVVVLVVVVVSVLTMLENKRTLAQAKAMSCFPWHLEVFLMFPIVLAIVWAFSSCVSAVIDKRANGGTNDYYDHGDRRKRRRRKKEMLSKHM